METVCPWCGQPSDRGQLNNRTETVIEFCNWYLGYIFIVASLVSILLLVAWLFQLLCWCWCWHRAMPCVCILGHCCEICSLSESAALRMANTSPEDFVNHNKTFLTRVYPNRMRVDSSNYNPQDLWNCGCQLGMHHTLLLGWNKGI